MKYRMVNMQVAKHIFGWKQVSGTRWQTPDDGILPLINWAEDLEQAIKILPIIHKLDLCIEIKDDTGSWEVCITKDGTHKPIHTVTLELGICLAALRAKGIEIDVVDTQ